MKTISKFIALILFASTALADYHPPVEYGVAVTIDFVLYNTDGTLDIDEADGGAEVTAHCDGDAGTTATNDFVDEGSYYSIALTAGEATCARITLDIAATDRNVVIIPTFGNASAQVDDDGAWLTDIPWNAAWDAEVESESSDALVAVNLDHWVGTATAIPALPAGTYHDLVRDDGTAVYDRTTESYQALRDRGDASWVTGAGGTGMSALANGVALSGTASTIGLAAAETFADDTLNGNIICIDSGTGVGQCRVISNYALTGDLATIEPDWTTNPASGSNYEVWPGSVNVSVWDGADITTALETSADIADAIRSEPCGSETADTFGDLICNDLEGLADGSIVGNSNVAQISGDATAADNLESYTDGTTPQPVNATQLSGDAVAADNAEAFFDGTGYAGTNNVIPLVTAITDTVNADVLQISGDVTAANNLELQYDTTGLTGNTFPAAQLALATAQTDLDTLTGSDGATISSASIQAFWDIQCEDQGSGLTCQEAMSILLAEAAGTAVYTSGTRTWVVKDPSGTETRLTLVYGAELDGDRSTSTLAPITP